MQKKSHNSEVGIKKREETVELQHSKPWHGMWVGSLAGARPNSKAKSLTDVQAVQTLGMSLDW